MEKVRTTIYVDPEIFNEFRILAIKQKQSVSALVEEFMKNEIEKEGEKNDTDNC